MSLSDESNKSYRLPVKRERARQLGEICISSAEYAHTHRHTLTDPHARTQTITRARVLIPRKGACVAGRDSNPLRLHQWRSRDAETRAGKRSYIRSTRTGFFVVSLHPAVFPFDIFWDRLFLPSRWPDFTCDSA